MQKKKIYVKKERGTKKEGVTRGWRKLHNEERHRDIGVKTFRKLDKVAKPAF
jgi:hypothetical protein